MNIKYLLSLIALLSISSYVAMATQAPAGQCYCSRICGYRNIKPADKPVQDADTGLYFCKIWDKKNYNKRCVLGNKK